jgi:4-amino-4-deoxy-L-arabinose transferase-like glycosyltransferase
MTSQTLILSRSPGRDRRAALPLVIALAAAGFLGLVSVFWVGFLGSDDSLYWAGASGWLAHFPYVGTSHWTLRHTLVVPIALARLVFGDGMTAMVLPILLYALGLIVVVGVWVGRVAGAAAAAAALLIMITNPQFLLLSSTAYIDLVELFFLVAGVALLHAAMERGGRVWLLLLSGVLLGAAMLSRETTVFAVVAVVLLFVAGFGMARWRYFVVGAGFLIPVGAESFALWAATGVMFYRSNIAIHHDSTIDRWVAQGAGVPLVHPLIDPVIMLLLSHDFALLFWIGVPLAIWLLRRCPLYPAEWRLTVLAAVVALVWSVLAAGLWTQLNLVPRYYLLPSVLVAILTGIALVRLAELGRRRLSLVLGGLLLASNIAGLSLDNRHFMWGEHELVAIAPSLPGTIHTSPQTLRRAELLLTWRGLQNRVTASPPQPGDLYYDDPTRAEAAPRPQPGWTVVEQLAPKENFGQWLLRTLGLKDRIPPSIWTRLGPGHPPVTLYRVG